MLTICRRHGLRTDTLTRIGGGTNVLFADGHGVVIKLYPPFGQHSADVERSVLAHVRGRLGVATPEIVATGTVEAGPTAWPYLVMTRLDGVALDSVWSALDPDSQVGIARALGTLIARLHSLPIAGLERFVRDWPAFVAGGVARCVGDQRAHGTPETWLAQLPGYLAQLPALYPPEFDPVLLSGDIHQDHLLVVERDGRWELAGLLDFDDATVGFREYELALPAMILMPRRPDLLRPLLLAYGYREDELDERLRARLLAYGLLHRYVGLPLLLSFADPAGACSTLTDLERSALAFG